MKEPLVSVIVPTYNSAHYLRECITSIQGQSMCCLEAIVVDDGSLDGSGSICDEYALMDDRTIVIHKRNQGQATSRNLGVKIAKTDYISFVDSDDIIHRDMLKQLYQELVSQNLSISSCSFIEDVVKPDHFDEQFSDDATCVIDLNEDNMLYLYHNSIAYWCVWGKLINKQIILNHPFEEGRFYEDNAVMCKWLYDAKKMAEIPSKCYFYRQNPNGTTRSDFSEKQLDYLWALKDQIDFYYSIRYIKMVKTVSSSFFKVLYSYIEAARSHKLDKTKIGETIRYAWGMMLKNHMYIDKVYYHFLKLSKLTIHILMKGNNI